MIAGIGDALQLLFQALKPGNPVADIGKMRLGDGMGLPAWRALAVGQVQQGADRVQRKPQRPAMCDKAQPVTARGRVAALISRAAAIAGKQADFLVIADGGHLDPAGLRQLADRKHESPP